MKLLCQETGKNEFKDGKFNILRIFYKSDNWSFTVSKLSFSKIGFQIDENAFIWKLY